MLGWMTTDVWTQLRRTLDAKIWIGTTSEWRGGIPEVAEVVICPIQSLNESLLYITSYCKL